GRPAIRPAAGRAAQRVQRCGCGGGGGGPGHPRRPVHRRAGRVPAPVRTNRGAALRRTHAVGGADEEPRRRRRDHPAGRGRTGPSPPWPRTRPCSTFAARCWDPVPPASPTSPVEGPPTLTPRPTLTADLRIAHLYPDLLRTYGDRGNLLALARRSEWRGFSV